MTDQPVAVPTAERIAELRDREMSDEELESYRAEVSRLLSERDAAVRRAEEAEAARAADITVLRNLADAMRSKGFDAAAGALDGVLDVQGVPQPAEDRAEKLLRAGYCRCGEAPMSEMVEAWSCPECAFTFSAEHVDVKDGGYTCPACAEIRLEAEVRVLQARIARVEALADAQDGRDGYVMAYALRAAVASKGNDRELAFDGSDVKQTTEDLHSGADETPERCYGCGELVTKRHWQGACVEPDPRSPVVPVPPEETK